MHLPSDERHQVPTAQQKRHLDKQKVDSRFDKARRCHRGTNLKRKLVVIKEDHSTTK